MTTAPKCRRCGGTGLEPGPTAAQQAVLDELQELGERRKLHSASRTLAGRTELAAAYTDIRSATARAKKLKLPVLQVAEALGMSRSALYDILSGKAGG